MERKFQSVSLEDSKTVRFNSGSVLNYDHVGFEIQEQITRTATRRVLWPREHASVSINKKLYSLLIFIVFNSTPSSLLRAILPIQVPYRDLLDPDTCPIRARTNHKRVNQASPPIIRVSPSA